MNNIKYILSLAFLTTSFAFSQNLDLDSCKTLALKNNWEIKSAQYELEASKQVKKEAFTKYFPTVRADAFAMRATDYMIKQDIPQMNLPVYDGNPMNLLAPTQFAYFPGMEIKTLDYTNVGTISAVQPIFAGGRIYNGNKLAKLGVELNEDRLKNSTEDILLKTESYYWQIITLKEKRNTLNIYQKLLESLYKDVNIALNAGLVQKSDLLKVQLKLNEVSANKLKLENGITLSKMAFCQIIGIEYSENFDLDDNLNINEIPESVYANYNEALLNRNEYAMLNKAVEAENIRKNMIIGENLPQISIGVQGLYLDMFEQQNSHGILFATVSVPISGWWEASYKINEHKIKAEIARNNLEQKSELMLLQMEKSYKDLNEGFQQIKIAESSVTQANEHLRVINDNNKAGIINTSDLLEAQLMYQQAENQLLEAQFNYKIKLLVYKKSIAN